MTEDTEVREDQPDDRLDIRTTERGFDFHRAVPSEYGGGVQVSESSNAGYAGVWLRAAAVPGMVTVAEDRTEVAINLLATNAWMIARQLARTVTHHYQGDARPEEALAGARAAVADITGWGPSIAETLLRRLAHRGFVLVDVGAAVPDEPEPVRELESVATVNFTAGENVDQEPGNGELVALYTPRDTIDQVYIRDDASSRDGEYDDDERWFPVGGDDYDEDDGPSTWRELLAHSKDGWRLVRLHRGSMPPGVSVVKEWGVWSTDGTVYEVNPPTEDKAVYEATLLYRGSPDEPGEQGCAPASRYVMRYPGVPGMANRVDSGWSRPSTWAPPPEGLVEPAAPVEPDGRTVLERLVRAAGPSGLRVRYIRDHLRAGGEWGPPIDVSDTTVHTWLAGPPDWVAPREKGKGAPFVHRDCLPDRPAVAGPEDSSE